MRRNSPPARPLLVVSISPGAAIKIIPPAIIAIVNAPQVPKIDIPTMASPIDTMHSFRGMVACLLPSVQNFCFKALQYSYNFVESKGVVQHFLLHPLEELLQLQ